MSDRIAVMYLGTIVEIGNAKDIFEDARAINYSDSFISMTISNILFPNSVRLYIKNLPFFL